MAFCAQFDDANDMLAPTLASRSPLMSLAGLAVLAILVFVAALLIGSSGIAVNKALAALAGSGDEATRNVLLAVRLPRVLAAFGVGGLLALAGVSVSLAIGAAIPVEALCGLAGIGQLAWQAALARDLPLLMNITVLVTLVTLLANSSADVIGHVWRGQQA